MTNSRKLMLSDVLRYFRDVLVETKARTDNRDALNELSKAYDLVLQSAYEVNDRAVANVLENLVDAAIDAGTGDDWKSHMPTDSEIDMAVTNA